MPHGPEITSLDAVTLSVSNMADSVAFYRALGFDDVKFGGPDAAFTSYRVGTSHLNLQLVTEVPAAAWGRPVFHVVDVDASYDAAVAAGLNPEFAPEDAPWGERYFHIRDPNGHEISIATPL